MAKYKFHSIIFTDRDAPESHIRDLETLERYCSDNPGLCHREDYNGFSSFQIETSDHKLAFILRLELTETYFYSDN